MFCLFTLLIFSIAKGEIVESATLIHEAHLKEVMFLFCISLLSIRLLVALPFSFAFGPPPPSFLILNLDYYIISR